MACSTDAGVTFGQTVRGGTRHALVRASLFYQRAVWLGWARECPAGGGG